MPYGDLERQAVQRFAAVADLEQANCTVEEREEYEPHLAAGSVVYAGVDYARVLQLAQEQADVILWDGGNNDLPFFASDLSIVLADPHRLGHERTYYPGEANLLRAHVVVLSKVDTAAPENVAALRDSVRQANARAQIVEAALPATLEGVERIRGARVLVIEDGPTLTHGGMAIGAGALAAQRLGAKQLVDPRPYAAGSLRNMFADYPHIGPVLPAMGYGPAQLMDLAQTIQRTPCDLVLIASPVDLRRLIPIAQPVGLLSYRFEQTAGPPLADLVEPIIRMARGA
jgi:predicted GTPase